MSLVGPRTPSYAALVTSVRREGEALLSAARSDASETPVPTCPGWTIADLAAHVWQVYANVTLYVSTRATERAEQLPERPAGDPVELLAGQLDALVAALSDCPPDTPIWTWVFDAPDSATFWARRMAHESAVHRFDAQNARGIREPVDDELAGDGIDELIDVVAPRIYSRDEVTGPTGTIALRASDGDSWRLELSPDGVRRSELVEAPQVTASGTKSALLLALYGRVPWTSLELDGDVTLLNQWTACLSF
ncbi:MAG TPA: maleylpyruvate isomerase family mycothiol-dependent enzyme [Mycobacteriales bacterium]|nr:maleylpyruvate isomerase family mycothiol-dependent enzyme [Mycobacteriales bacterium]